MPERAGWLLLEPGSLLRWAHHALTPRRDRDERPAAALHGALGAILHGLEEVRPAYVLVAWDSAPPTWRHEAWPLYGADREPDPPELADQQVRLAAVLARLEWPQLTIDGYAARDLLATLAASLAAEPVAILSADRDLCGLVGDNVTLWTPRPQHLRRFDPAAVVERYGVPPERFAEWRALVGDPGAGWAGVPGVGEKTAADWLTRYGPLEILLSARLPGERGAELRAQAEAVRGAWAVTRLAADAPLAPPPGGWPRSDPDPAPFGAQLAEWGFHDLTRRLSPRLLAASGAPSYRLATDAATVARLVTAAREARVIGLAGGRGGLALSLTRAEAWHVPHELAAPLLDALAAGEPQALVHDLLALPPALAAAWPATVGDAALAMWLLDPLRPRPSLFEAGRQWLDLRPEPPADLPAEPASLCLEADWVRRVEPLVAAEIESARLGGVYRRGQLPLQRALAAVQAGTLPLADGPWRPLLRRAPGSSGRWGLSRLEAAELAATLRPPADERWVELRFVDPALHLLAHLSGDRALLGLLNDAAAVGEDPPAHLAARLWERAPADVDDGQRRTAAALSAAAARGGDLPWLTRRLGRPRAEAEALWRAWRATFPATEAWRADLLTRGRRRGHAPTLGGRRLPVSGQSAAALSREVLEAALGDLLGQALLAAGPAARAPLPTGWLLAWPAAEAEGGIEAVAEAWSRLLEGDPWLRMRRLTIGGG